MELQILEQDGLKLSVSNAMLLTKQEPAFKKTTWCFLKNLKLFAIMLKQVLSQQSTLWLTVLQDQGFLPICLQDGHPQKQRARSTAVKSRLLAAIQNMQAPNCR